MTEHTKRLTAEERNAPAFRHTVSYQGGRTEPALGTLDQRLSIIIRRQGGRTRAPRMSESERQDYLEWCALKGITTPDLGWDND